MRSSAHREAWGRAARCPRPGPPVVDLGRRAVQPFVGQHRPLGRRGADGRRHRHAPDGSRDAATSAVLARSEGLVAGTAAVDHLLQIWAPKCACRGARATAVRSATATKSGASPALPTCCWPSSVPSSTCSGSCPASPLGSDVGHGCSRTGGLHQKNRLRIVGQMGRASWWLPHASPESTRRADAQGKRPRGLRRG